MSLFCNMGVLGVSEMLESVTSAHSQVRQFQYSNNDTFCSPLRPVSDNSIPCLAK